MPLTNIAADDIIESADHKIELPDFTRTYGFDIRPEVSLLKNKKHVSGKTKLKSLGKKFKKKLQKNNGGNIRYGVQNYTKYTGSKRYGIGVHRKLGNKEKDSIAIHGNGLSYQRQNEQTKYYIGVDSRNPVNTNREEESTYMFIGIKSSW